MIRFCGLSAAALALMAAACSAPVPSSQGGTELWMANSRGYDEVLGSVRAGIDITLEREEFHIYDRDGSGVYRAGLPRRTRRLFTKRI